MTRSTLSLTNDLVDYLAAHNRPLTELERDLVAETDKTGHSSMQIASDQADFMKMLVQLVGAKFAVEVGTFTGYSSLAIAAGLAPGGKLLCCDVSTEWTDVARRYWERAGVSDRIELRIAPAVETLRALPKEPHVDFSFIDADKVSYRQYWDELVERTRPGGILVVDNVLQDGRITDADHPSESVQAVREFNEYVLNDARVDFVMVPLADGLTIARRR